MSPATGRSGRPALPLLTAGQMQAWDRTAIDELAISEAVLMETAGRGAARVLHELYPEGRIAAAFGKGNNGGDAIVLLRTLRSWGREVIAVPVGGATVPQALLHGWDLPIAEPGDAASAFRDSAVLVDGILGTGASGPPRVPQIGCIDAMHAARRPIVALDGPTGVDLTRGSVSGAAVRASVTITFGAPKRGLLLHPGRVHAGRIVVLETAFPPYRGDAAAVITDEWVASRWRPLPPDSHKGIAGRLVVLAGRPAMGGAAIMCAHAALRAGAGIVRVVSWEQNRVPIQTALPEAIFVHREAADLAEEVRAAKTLVAGPGMGTDAESHETLGRMLGAATCPVLLDADALTLLAANPSLLPAAIAPRTLLTPHPGEMARLLGCLVEDVAADPFAAVEEASSRFGCTVMLKGMPTLLAAPGAPTRASIAGHSGVGVGGMGDTLAGLAGALLARGMGVTDAAALAIHFAGCAADRLGRGRPLLPRDVAEALPDILAGARATSQRLPFVDVLLDLPPAV